MQIAKEIAEFLKIYSKDNPSSLPWCTKGDAIEAMKRRGNKQATVLTTNKIKHHKKRGRIRCKGEVWLIYEISFITIKRRQWTLFVQRKTAVKLLWLYFVSILTHFNKECLVMFVCDLQSYCNLFFITDHLFHCCFPRWKTHLSGKSISS